MARKPRYAEPNEFSVNKKIALASVSLNRQTQNQKLCMIVIDTALVKFPSDFKNVLNNVLFQTSNQNAQKTHLRLLLILKNIIPLPMSVTINLY